MEELIDVKILLEDENCLPKKATEDSAGFDVFAAEGCNLMPGSITLVPLGFFVEVPRGYEMQIRARSGMAKKGIMVANGVGTIDSDYRGRVGVLLYNSTNVGYFITKGDRVAQAIIAEVPRVRLSVVENLSETDRGEGGFGSTGK